MEYSADMLGKGRFFQKTEREAWRMLSGHTHRTAGRYEKILVGDSIDRPKRDTPKIHRAGSRRQPNTAAFSDHDRTLMDSEHGTEGRSEARGEGGLHGLSSPGPPPRPPLTLVQDGVGRLVAGQRFLGQMLMALGQTLHLGEASVEGHGWVAGVLSHIQVGGAA